MIWVLGASAVAAAVVVARMAMKDEAEKGKVLGEFFEQADADRKRWLERTVSAARAVKIADKRSTPLLHRPIYDCASDEFQLPCAQAVYDDSGLNDRGVGWLTSDELEKHLEEFSSQAARDANGGECIVFVDGGDHLVVVVNGGGSVNDPGGKAFRYVRTGESEWFVWWWRTGMRGVPEDPAFLMLELAKHPERWARREDEALAAARKNGEYRPVARLCKHGQAPS